MASKQQAEPELMRDDTHGHFWQPRKERDAISTEARKWREENADAAAAWARWFEARGVPLRPLF